MTVASRNGAVSFLGLAVFLSLGAAGCTTFDTGRSGLAHLVSPSQNAVAEIAPGEPFYTIDIRTVGRKPKEVKAPLPQVVQVGTVADDPITVQDAIDRVKARLPFRRMKVSVLRPTGRPKTPLARMNVRFKSGHRVTIDTDYALHPGDRILIVQDTERMPRGPLDWFTGATLGKTLGHRRSE